MKEFKSVEDIVEFAILAEQEAVDFYSDLATRSKNDGIRKVFQEFAGEEMKHKSRLLSIREERSLKLPEGTVSDMKTADYMADVSPKPDITYPDALILAMKKEKLAFRLYSFLAEETTDPALKNLFQNLALEESRHKLRFEIEYDEYVLKEN